MRWTLVLALILGLFVATTGCDEDDRGPASESTRGAQQGTATAAADTSSSLGNRGVRDLASEDRASSDSDAAIPRNRDLGLPREGGAGGIEDPLPRPAGGDDLASSDSSRNPGSDVAPPPPAPARQPIRDGLTGSRLRGFEDWLVEEPPRTPNPVPPFGFPPRQSPEAPREEIVPPPSTSALAEEGTGGGGNASGEEPIPEPSTVVLFLAGIALLYLVYRKR
jgi:hypothetical protein